MRGDAAGKTREAMPSPETGGGTGWGLTRDDAGTVARVLVLPSYTHFFLLNHPQMSSASSTICASANSLPQDQLSSGMLLKFIP